MAGMVSLCPEGCQPAPANFWAFRHVKDRTRRGMLEGDAPSAWSTDAGGMTMFWNQEGNRKLFRIAERGFLESSPCRKERVSRLLLRIRIYFLFRDLAR